MAGVRISEKDVQASCLEYLAVRRHFFFRLNNMPIFSGGEFRSLGKYTPKGLPDAVVVRLGIFVGLEFKASDGSLSPEQKLLGEKLEKAGGEYYVIRSIEDLQSIGL